MAIQITNRQLKKLEPYALDSYINELVSHCNEKFPHLKKTMGIENLKQVLRQSVNKANEQGFTQRGPVKFYIDLLIAFGYDFDTDPQYYWIQNILRKNEHLSQIELSTILYKQIKRYSEFTSGEDNQFLYKVAERLDSLSIHTIKVSKDSFIDNIQYLLEYIYPEKYQQIGSEAVEQLIFESINKANNEYQFTQVNYVSLLTVLMFILGHQFDSDPFYAWAAKEKTIRLTDNNVARNSEVVVNRLEKCAKIWLTATLKNDYSTNLNKDLI